MSDTPTLELSLLQCAADVHAAEATMLDRLVAYAATNEWQGAGIRSFGHWCDINLGILSQRAGKIARAAERLAVLPALRAAFAEGTVSLDKVLLLAPVASPSTDERFTMIAVAASASQLQRICSAYRNQDRDDSPEAEEARHLKRSLTSTRMDEGLVRIVAVLEPDEAAIVLAAIDRRVEANWRRDRDSEDDIPRTELSERRVTALVELAVDGIEAGPDPVVRGEHIDVRVNVDAELLNGTRDDGLCEIDGIGAVAPAVIRRLCCDARVCTVREQLDGIFNLGRTQRLPNRQQRRSLHRRDGGCRFPGCRMRRYVDAHHVLPWEANGPTDIDNLMLLCREHHRLFHEGAYTITAHGGGRFTFFRPDGNPVARPPCRTRPGATPTAPGSPRATDGGGRYDLDLTIDALQDHPRAS